MNTSTKVDLRQGANLTFPMMKKITFQTNKWGKKGKGFLIPFKIKILAHKPTIPQNNIFTTQISQMMLDAQSV